MSIGRGKESIPILEILINVAKKMQVNSLKSIYATSQPDGHRTGLIAKSEAAEAPSVVIRELNERLDQALADADEAKELINSSTLFSRRDYSTTLPHAAELNFSINRTDSATPAIQTDKSTSAATTVILSQTKITAGVVSSNSGITFKK